MFGGFKLGVTVPVTSSVTREVLAVLLGSSAKALVQSPSAKMAGKNKRSSRTAAHFGCEVCCGIVRLIFKIAYSLVKQRNWLNFGKIILSKSPQVKFY